MSALPRTTAFSLNVASSSSPLVVGACSPGDEVGLISLSALGASQSDRGSCLGFSIPCRAVRRPESGGSLPRQGWRGVARAAFRDGRRSLGASPASVARCSLGRTGAVPSALMRALGRAKEERWTVLLLAGAGARTSSRGQWALLVLDARNQDVWARADAQEAWEADARYPLKAPYGRHAASRYCGCGCAAVPARVCGRCWTAGGSSLRASPRRARSGPRPLVPPPCQAVGRPSCAARSLSPRAMIAGSPRRVLWSM